jgi:hypothetical protein
MAPVSSGMHTTSNPQPSRPILLQIPSWESFLAARQPMVNRIMNHCRSLSILQPQPGTCSEADVQHFVGAPLTRLMECAFVLPGPTDRTPTAGGLVDHILRRCLSTLSSVRTNEVLAAEALHHLYVALFQDLALAFHVDVHKTSYPSDPWDPCLHTLREWVNGCDRSTLWPSGPQTQQISITSRAGICPHGSAAYFLRMLPQEYPRMISGAAGASRLAAWLSRGTDIALPVWAERRGAAAWAAMCANLQIIIDEEIYVLQQPMSCQLATRLNPNAASPAM